MKYSINIFILLSLVYCELDKINLNQYHPDELKQLPLTDQQINNLAEYVSIVTDLSPEVIHIPDRPREVKNAFCSSEKIKKEFNYNAKVSLVATLISMVEWVNERGSQKFDYHLPIEITNRDELPRTWKDRLF